MLAAPAPRPLAWRRAVGRFASLALPLGLATTVLILLWQGLDVAVLRRQLSTLPWPALTLGVLGLLLGHGLRAARLQAEWQDLALPVRFRACLRIALIHNAWVQLLPFRSGELSYVWLLRREWHIDWRDAGVSLLWLRLQDACVLGGLSLLILPLMVHHHAWPAGISPVWLGLAVAALAALVAVAIRLRQHPRLARIRQAWAHGRRLRRGGLTGWGLCAAHWLSKLGVAACLLALLLNLTLQKSAALALGGELGALLPLQAPAGLGAYEAGVWALFCSVTGHAPLNTHSPLLGTVLAAALLVHVLAIVVTLMAGALAAATHPLRLRSNSASAPT